MEKYQGSLIVVAAPSGGGKTSLVRALLKTMNDIEVSVSHTTRAPRPGEQDTRDYYFISQNQFEGMVEENAFIEYAKVFDNYYGTSRQQILEKLESGIDILFDIDWQGAQQLKTHFQEDVISVFILPPSRQALRNRLTERNQDSDRIVEERMKQAQSEMAHYDQFDYIIINDDFDLALSELTCIVTANRKKLTKQQLKHTKLLSLLLSQQ